MDWHNAINLVTPHVVKIETQVGHGSGFLAFYNMDSSFCGIATAAHVIAHADDWQQPIKIRSAAGGVPTFLQASDRVIYLDRATDSAILLFLKGELKLPERPIALLPMDTPCGIGSEVGWLGYPAIEPNSLCFFAGSVSARPNPSAYLIDGVAIHGVSGGPVFNCAEADKVQIVGSVSAYHANRATGEALPGLLRAQDVSHFHAVATKIRSIDEAHEQKRKFEEERKKKAEEAAAKPPEELAQSPKQESGDDNETAIT